MSLDSSSRQSSLDSDLAKVLSVDAEAVKGDQSNLTALAAQMVHGSR
jgi:hypothetical protein